MEHLQIASFKAVLLAVEAGMCTHETAAFPACQHHQPVPIASHMDHHPRGLCRCPDGDTQSFLALPEIPALCPR